MSFDYETAAMLSKHSCDKVVRFAQNARWDSADRESLRGMIVTLNADLRLAQAEIEMLKRLLLELECKP